MAAPVTPQITAHDIQGFKYFRLLGPLFAHLHAAGTERDRAGNRQLFYDQYAALLLVYFFSPTVTSLRGLQQATTLATVQQRLGVRRTSLGALSEAAYVFDAALLHEGDGLYRGRGRVTMAGRWDVTVVASRGGNRLGSRQFAIVAQ